jgi:hypothetical protein
MIPTMNGGGRTSRWASALALPLALWSAVPGVQWCPLGWAEVSPACYVACVSPAAILDVGTKRCCERSCPASQGHCAADASDSCPVQAGPFACGPDAPDSAPADRYPGGRAYCLGGPSGGDGLAPGTLEAPDASGPGAALPAEAAVARPGSVACPVVAALTRPPPSPIGAVPRGRAPPSVGWATD